MKSTSYPIKSAPLTTLGYSILLISGVVTDTSSTTLITKSIALSNTFTVSESCAPSFNFVTISFCYSLTLALSDTDSFGKLDFKPNSFTDTFGLVSLLIGLVISNFG